MGPPSGPPPNVKRRLITSNSKLDSSTSSKAPRVLANDSSAMDSLLSTPKNRPTAIRYISSSSRGVFSGNRSARSASTSMVEASVILAISEGRGKARGEIGMAAVDLRHPHLVLCQFSDTLLYTHTLTKINYFNPIEIIVPHTFCEGAQPNQLYQLIKDQYPLITVTAVQRRHYNDSNGRQQIQSLCAPQYSAVYLQVLHKYGILSVCQKSPSHNLSRFLQCVANLAKINMWLCISCVSDTPAGLLLVQEILPLSIRHCFRFYALTAAAAVLKYVEYIQCIVFARESLKVAYHSSEDTMMIDVGTATQLELVQPLLPSAGPTCCLLGVLGPTYTVGGIRALRAGILQPSCKKEFIEARLDAVQELMENDSGIMTSLQDFENPHYKEIADRIRSILLDDAHLEKGAMGSLQRCFAIKPEINGLLDVARRTYSELIDDIQKIVEQLSETYDLPIRLTQNVMKGFHIAMPVSPKNRRSFNVADLPSIFIQVHFNGASVSMTTEELVVLDHQAKEALNEIQKMIITALLKDLRPFMASLYKLCEIVAELDILIALAQISSVGSYIRPEFSDYLDIRNSVHPLLDYNSQVMPVPNDVFASPEYNFRIITGPNMGGKTIYIKQIAIMQVMSQLGCYIPATNAVLRLCDRIFSRIGFNDSVELNASTYVIEMKEIQHILKGITRSSLVIIDELCRGTCIEEGASIAWAICEELILSEAFTFFTTHFLYLTRLEDLYFNVVNRHTAVAEETVGTENTQKRLVYQHKIEAGVTKIGHYGLALAEKTSLPEQTINLAKELAELIASRRKPQKHSLHAKSDDRCLYEINARIAQELRINQSSANIKNILEKFKSDNPHIIDNLREENSKSTSYSKGQTTTNTNNNFSESNIFNDTTTRTDCNLMKNLSTEVTKTNDAEEQIHDFGNRYTAVKSSKELLNPFLSSNNLESDNISEIAMEHSQTQDNIKFSNETNNAKDNFENSNSDPKTIENSYSALDNTNPNNSFDPTDNNGISKDDDSDSEIAIALTQVIPENSGSQSSDILSSEEELFMETVNEIKESMNNIDLERCILTPPDGFRDD
ncbi:mutS protein homolog 4 [Pieris rapae]|uniref:mutS protein homolog 4 n=1 Tax=Pieris rapae TaxID=64459 RepID=UPI001E27C2FB|nr:mutS protein homolog 4 [Pieris rapae]